MQPIVTTHPPANALLAIDTNDDKVFDKLSGLRVDLKTPAQVFINNQRPLLAGYFNRISLTEINVNWATPNVNATNNTLTMEVTRGSAGTSIERLVIPEGFYKPSELADVIEEQFLELFGEFLEYVPTVLNPYPLLCIYQEKSRSFTFQLSNGVTDLFIFSILSKVKRPIEGLSQVDDDLTEMMGIVPTPQCQDLTFLQGGFASMVYTPYIDIVSNSLTKNQKVADGDSASSFTSSKLARIYLSNEHIEATTEDNIIGVRPFTFRREFSNPKQIQWNNTENIDFVDLTVLDHKGRPIYITPLETRIQSDQMTLVVGNQANIQFTLFVTEV